MEGFTYECVSLLSNKYIYYILDLLGVPCDSLFVGGSHMNVFPV